MSEIPRPRIDAKESLIVVLLTTLVVALLPLWAAVGLALELAVALAIPMIFAACVLYGLITGIKVVVHRMGSAPSSGHQI